jgi:succinate dehydrogenase / fumarate reductase flavoprotein subunit
MRRYAKEQKSGGSTRQRNDGAEALELLARRRGPYQVQYALQEMMQDPVGIVRTEPEMDRALEGLGSLRARRGSASGNRQYNPGWHTASISSTS